MQKFLRQAGIKWLKNVKKIEKISNIISSSIPLSSFKYKFLLREFFFSKTTFQNCQETCEESI
jgi:hypothetical protein